MYLTPIALFALAHFAAAAPKPKPLPFQVTNLNTFEPSGRPGGNNIYRVGFHVVDLNDSAAAFCEARWDYEQRDTGYPSQYLANCTVSGEGSAIDPAWAFKFVDWNSYYNFTLDVRHKGAKTVKKPVRFAKGKVDFDIIQCAHAASGFSVCNQKEGIAFPLAVYKEKKKV